MHLHRPGARLRPGARTLKGIALSLQMGRRARAPFPTNCGVYTQYLLRRSNTPPLSAGTTHVTGMSASARSPGPYHESEIYYQCLLSRLPDTVQRQINLARITSRSSHNARMLGFSLSVPLLRGIKYNPPETLKRRLWEGLGEAVGHHLFRAHQVDVDHVAKDKIT